MDADITALCEGHARMPRDVARWTALRLPHHVTPDDLEPAAWEGLYDAARTWQADRGPFKAWARLKITAAILADLRAGDHQSRRWRARQNRLDQARDDLLARNGRPPTPGQAAEAAGVSPAVLARHEQDRVRMLPLDRDDFDPHQLVRDPALTADEEAGQHDLDGWVRAAVLALPERKREVIYGLYWRGQTTAALADTFGVDPSRVSQIRAEAVTAIRDALNWHLDHDPGPPLIPRMDRRRRVYRDAVAYAYELHRD